MTCRMTTSAHDELIALRTAFIAWVRALIARHPAQAQNERHYLHLAATAQLGELRQRVQTKGMATAFEIGTRVLLWRPDWTPTESATVWHPSYDCEIGVHKWAVRDVAAGAV